LNYNYYKISSFVLCLLLFSNVQTSYGESEPVMITYSDKMNGIVFDGKWTFFSEWKSSSVNQVNELLKIRSAHHDEFIYIFVDALYDSSLEIGSDRSLICFDSQHDKTISSDSNDYCFQAILGRDSGFTLQGGTSFASKSFFQQIPNHQDFIAIGEISDGNDRYSKQPHASYEYKIPIDVISRSNSYGFYVEAFDAKSGKSVTWPANIVKKTPTHIPGPNFWGDMISIDKSLPEFPLPILILVVLVMTVILLSKKLNSGRLTINNL